MKKIEMSSEITVELVRSMAADEYVVQAAQASLKGKNDPVDDALKDKYRLRSIRLLKTLGIKDLTIKKKRPTNPKILINYLAKDRHGSPFEHTAFTFYIEAPIFVFREWQRHRMSSFNEMSGRYTVLKPKFYTPGPDRKMINIGTSAKPEMARGKARLHRLMKWTDYAISYLAWTAYKMRLKAGISNELSRTILPGNIYSQMYWTVNARSLMNFLSLRVQSDESTYMTRPQMEIQMGAEKIEQIFAELMPDTYAAFVANGRVAP